MARAKTPKPEAPPPAEAATPAEAPQVASVPPVGGTVSDRLDEAVRRALDAAAAALDATEEAARQADQQRKLLEASLKAQKRSQTLALGGAAVTVFAVLVGGLVYFRSVADLRETAATQAAANEVMVKNLIDLGKAVSALNGGAMTEQPANAEQPASESATDGTTANPAPLSANDKLDRILAAVEQKPAAPTPEAAPAQPTDLQPALDALKADLLAANSEMELSLNQTMTKAGVTLTPDLMAIMADLRTSLDKSGGGKASSQPAPPKKSSGKGGKTSSGKSASSATGQPDNPYHFP